MCLCVPEPTDWQNVKNITAALSNICTQTDPCRLLLQEYICQYFSCVCVCEGQTAWSQILQSLPSPIGWTYFLFLYCSTLHLFEVNFNKNCIPLFCTSGLQIMKHIDLRIASRSIVTLQLEGNQGRRGSKCRWRDRERECTI